jgi:hypothetical protein
MCILVHPVDTERADKFRDFIVLIRVLSLHKGLSRAIFPLR